MAYGNPHSKKKGGSWKTSTGPGGSKAPTAPVKKGPGGPYITGPGGAGREAVPEMKPKACKPVQRGGDKRPFITGPGGAPGFRIELPMHNENGDNNKEYTETETESPALAVETGPTTSDQPVKEKRSWFRKKVKKTKGEGSIMRHRRQLEEALRATDEG